MLRRAYRRMPIVIITSEMAIHRITQRTAGMPVAAAIFAASDEASVEVVITNRVFKLKNALSRHWTARNASEKFTHFSAANLAIADSPAVRTAPENTVNTMLKKVTFARKFEKGAMNPNTIVITPTKPESM